MRYLLDTNVVSDLVRNPQGKVESSISNESSDH
jgi:predicted nucleic acid-binding protein